MGFGVGPARAGIEFVIPGGGAEIGAGIAGFLGVPFDCEIEAVELLPDQPGSIKVDIWKCTYAQFDAGATHPVDADTITGGNEPEIVAGSKDQDTILTGWTVILAQGDILAFNVDSATTITRCTVILRVREP